MSVSAFFEKLLGHQRQKDQASIASYRDLVTGLAAGDEPHPADVERLLGDADKSIDDLRRDVERLQHRIELKASAAAVPALEAERRTLDEQIAAADKLFEAAERQHDETVQPLYDRRREVDQALSSGATARMELVSSCDDAALRREMSQLEVASQRSDESLRELTTRARQLEHKAEYEHEAAEHELVLSESTRRREQAAIYEKEAQAIRRDVKKLQDSQADLNKRRELLEQRMRQA